MLLVRQVSRVSVRRDTASSAGADKYKPLPPGFWLLQVHGNCPRCHHHHTAVTIKIDVTTNSSKLNHVQCENCREKWLAFAGNNSTQISLLSTTTIKPDPIEKEVRLALITLVKSAAPFTAIASPTLAGIPETTSPGTHGESSTRPPTNSRFEPTSRQARTPSRVSFNLPPSSIHGQTSTSFSSTQTSNSDAHEQAHRVSQKSRSSLKQMMRTRLHKLRDLNWTKALTRSKRRTISAKKRGKLPVQVPVEEDHQAPDDQHVDTILEPETTGPAIADPRDRSEEATKFLDGLKNDIIELMDSKERAAWIRAKYTQFKTQRAKPTPSRNSTTVDTGTQAQAPTRDSSSILHYIFGAGSHLSYMDRGSVSEPSIRTRPLSISGSEANTLVDENTFAPSVPLYRILHREHGRSRSPRPSSFHRSWQQIRQHRDQTRASFDSTTTGGAVRSSSTARDPTVNRLSRGSIGRASTFGLTEMFRSQTSIQEHVSAEEPVSDEQSSSPPLPLSPPMPQSPAQSST